MLVDFGPCQSGYHVGCLGRVKGAGHLLNISNARALEDHPRNVPDDIFGSAPPANGGIVMVNFYPGYLSEETAPEASAGFAEEARFKALYAGQPDRIEVAFMSWDAGHPRPETPVATALLITLNI